MDNVSIRPPRLLVPALTTLVMIATLLSLGLWQLQRRAEKHALIAALGERFTAEPASLPAPAEWNALRAADDEFRRVRFRAVVDVSMEAGVYASGSSLRKDISGPGVWAFVPTRLESGETVIVNRGFAPDAQSGALRKGDASAPIDMIGYIRFPERPGWLTPAGDQGKRLWFARDIQAMAQAFGWGGGKVAPFYLDLEAPMPVSGWPKPGPIQINFKDDHLQYALTWFALAIAVLIGFAAWVRGRTRV